MNAKQELDGIGPWPPLFYTRVRAALPTLGLDLRRLAESCLSCREETSHELDAHQDKLHVKILHPHLM